MASVPPPPRSWEKFEWISFPVVSLVLIGVIIFLLAGSADNIENKVSIAQQGDIPLLISLLQDGSNIGRERAAGALLNLAADNDDNKVLIAREGGIPLYSAMDPIPVKIKLLEH